MQFRDWLVTEKQDDPGQGSLFDKSLDLKSSPQASRFKDTAGKLCPFDAFGRDNPSIGKFARQSPENMAQVAMFSPLSARTLFINLEKQFPVVVYLLRFLFKHNTVTREELDQVLKQYFNKTGANTRSVVFGFKLDTVADIWNKRKQIYDTAMEMYRNNDTEGLMDLFSGINKEIGNISGIAPVKGGFIVQLLFGKVGCLDVHNVRIYRQLSDKMGWGISKDIDPEKWAKTDNEEGTRRGVREYLQTLEKLKERGIGVAELWNVWVDFVGKIYSLAKQAQPDEPALNPFDPQYKDIQGTQIDTKAPSWLLGGRKGQEKDVRIPVASGSEEGGEISRWHRNAAQEPEDLMRASDIAKHYPVLTQFPGLSPAAIKRRLAGTRQKQRSLF